MPKSCRTCARGKRKCDQQRPSCERCCRLNKQCIYDHDDDTSYEAENQIYPHESNIMTNVKHSIKPHSQGLIRHKQTNNIMTVDEAVQIIHKEKKIPRSKNINISISMTSIILSSPINRKAILEFIKGSKCKKHLKTSLDTNSFCFHHYTKKQFFEILW